MSLFKLFLVFVKIGAILLGGGYVILPILQNEFTEKRNLVSEEDLLTYFALSQSLPGIIATNMSVFIGYKLKGFLGGLAAMIGVIFFPFWTIVILASVIEILSGNNIVQGMLWGVGIAIIVLIFLTIKEAWQKTEKDNIFYFIFILSLIALLAVKLSPIQVILLFSIVGVILKRILKNTEVKNK